MADMTVQDIEGQLRIIRCNVHDPAFAHEIEDKLYRRFVREIAGMSIESARIRAADIIDEIHRKAKAINRSADIRFLRGYK